MSASVVQTHGLSVIVMLERVKREFRWRGDFWK